MIAGWNEVECLKVFTFLNEKVYLENKTSSAFIGQPGTEPELEIELRLFYRHMLLDHCKYPNECIFWLIQILKPWPTVNKARLLYILYGPVCTFSRCVLWDGMSTLSAPDTWLWELANAMRLLYNAENKDCNHDELISIVNELGGLSNGWWPENIARFIIMCGDTICFNFLASKAINVHTAQLSTLVVFLTMVCEKDGYCMQWMTKLIERLCAVMICVQDKRVFLNSIEKVFLRTILHLIPSLRDETLKEQLLLFLDFVSRYENLLKAPRMACVAECYINLLLDSVKLNADKS
uniref:F-box only protein 47 n=1 Tax=Myxine glutinosa TaxID=7769 RepID=UPI00358EDEFC